MSEPTFAQPERRWFLIPVLLALIVLALGLLAARHFFPSGTVEVETIQTSILPNTTVYKSDTGETGTNETAYTLFVVPTLKVTNKLRFPVSLEDFTLTVTDPKGAQLIGRALQKQELLNSEHSFPALKRFAPSPLMRDDVIAPGQSARGPVVFSLAFPASTWDTRASAVLQLDFYHQASVTVTLPR